MAEAHKVKPVEQNISMKIKIWDNLPFTMTQELGKGQLEGEHFEMLASYPLASTWFFKMKGKTYEVSLREAMLGLADIIFKEDKK